MVILRDRRHRETGPYGGLLALSVAADSIATIAGYPLPVWLWPLQLIAVGTAALLWIWTGAVFVDDYRPAWRDAVAWAVLPSLDAPPRQAGRIRTQLPNRPPPPAIRKTRCWRGCAGSWRRRRSIARKALASARWSRPLMCPNIACAG